MEFRRLLFLAARCPRVLQSSDLPSVPRHPGLDPGSMNTGERELISAVFMDPRIREDDGENHGFFSTENGLRFGCPASALAAASASLTSSRRYSARSASESRG